MKKLTALAALLIAGVLNAGEPLQAPPVYLPTAAVDQAPPVLPVPSAEQAMDIPATVLLAVNQCPGGNCGIQQAAAYQWVQAAPPKNAGYPNWCTHELMPQARTPVQAPAAPLAASANCTCPNCGASFPCPQAGVQAFRTAPVAFTTYAAAPARVGLFSRLRVNGGPGLFPQLFSGRLFGGCGGG